MKNQTWKKPAYPDFPIHTMRKNRWSSIVDLLEPIREEAHHDS